MSFTATVENDCIKLPPGFHLPDGTRVAVEPVTEGADQAELPTLFEVFEDFIGKAEGLPEDFAAEHNHYIHGTPKRGQP